jgi:hypothetical protein
MLRVLLWKIRLCATQKDFQTFLIIALKRVLEMVLEKVLERAPVRVPGKVPVKVLERMDLQRKQKIWQIL